MKQSSRKSGVLLVLLSLLVGFQGLSQSLTVDSCYALAVKNYPLIKQYGLIESAKEYTLSNAGKAYLPQISVTGIAGYVFTSSNSESKLIGMAQLNQVIWDGGATKARKKLIKNSAEADRAELDVSLYELRSRVNQLYFGVLLMDQQLALLDQKANILSNQEERIRELSENGLAYSIDLDEIKVEMLRIFQQKTEYQFVRDGYLNVLSLLVGVDLNESTVLQKPMMSQVSIEMPISRPEMHLFDTQRAKIESQDAQRKVDLMPKLGVMGVGIAMSPELSFGMMSLSSLGVLGLNASWNIGGLYKNENQKQLTQISLQRVALQEENFLFNTRLQTTQTKSDIQKQQSILAKDEEIVALRKKIREGYEVKYEAGMSSVLDLLDATNKESEANAQKALHEMQLLMSLYEYKTEVGIN